MTSIEAMQAVGGNERRNFLQTLTGNSWERKAKNVLGTAKKYHNGKQGIGHGNVLGLQKSRNVDIALYYNAMNAWNTRLQEVCKDIANKIILSVIDEESRQRRAWKSRVFKVPEENRQKRTSNLRLPAVSK